MTHALTTNDKRTDDSFENVFMPLPPLDPADPLELEIYARFMRHVRLVPNNRVDIKILSAIQFTADILDLADAYVSKALADMGLRAPRRAFPQSYLDHVDQTMQRSSWDVGAPCASSVDMNRFWNDIGEETGTSVKRGYEPARHAAARF